MPAIERYDGPAFRVLRRYLQNNEAPNESRRTEPDIYILSAEFGLIPANQHIPDYDRRMTRQRAEELYPCVTDDLRCLLNSESPCQELFVYLGKEYLGALEDWGKWVPSNVIVRTAQGSPGSRQGQLYDWLYGCPPPPVPITSRQDGTKLRGIEIRLTSQQALEVARQALRDDAQAAARYHTWYVQVDDQRVAPKWIVSKLTGLPVSTFVTGQARRLLTRLGVEVVRA